MRLTPEEQDMLAGGQGEPVRRALQTQLEVGQFFGAESMEPIASAHAAGDAWIMGEDGLRYLEEAVAQGAKLRVPTTYNPCSVDFDNWELFGQPPEHVERERRVVRALAAMGMMTAMTCINYQTVTPPRFNEHIAWGDTGAVIFANSVIGARSNYEGGPAAIAAGLTGRVPAYGYHLDSQRRGTVLVEVKDTPSEWADWGALGCWIGRQVTSYWEVPVLVGEHLDPSVDDLKHLGAALASYGSFALYHMVGVTPEAPTLEAACGGAEPSRKLVAETGTIASVYGSFQPEGERAHLVVFSAPQLSLDEIRVISETMAGRKVHPDTRMILTLSPQVKLEAARLGYVDDLEQAGAIVSSGTCFYVMTPELTLEKFGWKTLVTNSAKIVNIIEGSGYNPVLRPLETCLEAAVSGKIGSTP